MKKLLFTLTALLALNLSANAAFFCSKCDAEMGPGEGFECQSCDEYVCLDCWCSICDMWCNDCHDDYDGWCTECGDCMIYYGVVECWGCGNNFCSACICVECELYCLDCMEEFRCEDCYSCAIADGEAANCEICDALLCSEHQYGCIMCDGTFCIDDMCPECTAICMNCNPNCVDCGACCGDDPITCTTCGEYVCESCAIECDYCGSMFCPNCIQADCGYDCGICPDCHENNYGYCEECGECLFSKARCEDEFDDGHEEVCAECHEDFVCPGGCNRCFADDFDIICASCGFCEDCALDNEMHCPECEACYEDVGRCDDDGEHCRDCCENNEWLCEFCDHCAEAQGFDRCSECGACEDCVLDYNLHCITCGACLYNDYPDESTRPEYCESCMPTDEGIPCLVCDTRLDENGCTISGNGWHCAEHCSPCIFCYDVCFAENPDDACPYCGACPNCVESHHLHCAECGTCLYDEYPDDNTRPEYCYDCALANNGMPCNVCGNLISGNECLYGTDGFHCEYHCEACPTCHTVCLAETPACELCGRCTTCCSGHENEEGGTAINEENFPDDDLRDYLANLDPIADGNIYQGELGDTLDLSTFRGSNFDWINDLCPDLHRLRCTSAEQLNALSAEQKAQLTALYCPNIGITTLNLSEFPNLEYLDCSTNQITSLNANQCPNLRVLVCGENKFNTLDVSNCANLQTLDCKREKSGYTGISTLTLTGCNNLQALNCRGNGMSELDLSGCTNLQLLDCKYNCISELDLSGHTNLRTVNCGENYIYSELVLSGLSNLETLICTGNYDYILYLEGCTNLQRLECGESGLYAIENLSDCKNLKTLICNECSIDGTLDLSGFTNLQTLDCRWCDNLTGLDLTGCANLQTLDGQECWRIEEWNLSDCHNLQTLNLYGMVNIAQLNLTGCNNLQWFELSSENLDELDFSKMRKLQHLYLDAPQISNLDLGNCSNLEEVEAYGGNIRDINLTGCKKLQRFYFGGTELNSIKCSNNQKLQTFDVTLEYGRVDEVDLSGCKNLEYLNIPESSCELNLSGCYNLRYVKLKDVWSELGCFRFDKCEQLEYLYFEEWYIPDELTCSFKDFSEIGLKKNKMSNIDGVTYDGSIGKYKLTDNYIAFKYNNGAELCTITFNDIKHNYSTAEAVQHPTGVDITRTCAKCRKQSSEFYNRYYGETLDVRGCKGDMSWVSLFTELKKYYCDKTEHLDALTDAQKQQLTHLYASNYKYNASSSGYYFINSYNNNYKNLEVLSISDSYGGHISLKNATNLTGFYCTNNSNCQVELSGNTNLKKVRIKGNGGDFNLDFSSCTNMWSIETDIEGLNLRKCTNLKYVEAPYKGLKLPNTHVQTLVLKGAVPCTPNPASVSSLSYFDDNIDMKKVSNVTGATYNSVTQRWDLNSTIITYFYSDDKKTHRISYDYSHEAGRREYSNFKVTVTDETEVHGTEDDFGSYVCKYECEKCGKNITEKNKITTGHGIYVDVTKWTSSDWNSNRWWLEAYENYITSVKYDRCGDIVDDYELYNLREIHIPNAGLTKLGNWANFSRYAYLRVLDCPGNDFAQINISTLYDIEYVDVSSNYNLISLRLYGTSKLKHLDISDTQVPSINLSNAAKLETLNCSGNEHITSLSLTNCANLEEVYISSTPIQSLNLSGKKELKIVEANYNNSLTTINVSNCTKLETLECYSDYDEGSLTTLNLTGVTNLKTLYIAGNNNLSSSSFNSYTIPSLERLDVYDCGLDIDYSKKPHLKYLSCGGNDSYELDLSPLADLEKLACHYSSIEELDLSNNPKLEKVSCYYNEDLTSLNFGDNTNLTTLECYNCSIESLDLSKCNRLTMLNCHDNQLTSLELHNGGSSLEKIYCNNNAITDLNLSNFKGSSCFIDNNCLLYVDLSKCTAAPASVSIDDQYREIESLPCAFRFADLAKGMDDAKVFDVEGIEQFTDGKNTMWRIPSTNTNRYIEFYYRQGGNHSEMGGNIIHFEELTHTYQTGASRYYTDTIPATYDGPGSCICHYPCRYCDEELTEEIVIPRLLCNVTVKDARAEGCSVEMALGGELAPLSTHSGYNAKGGFINFKFDKGAEMELKAIDGEHYHFVSWSDGVTDIQRTIVYVCDSTLSAVFEPNPQAVTTIGQSNGTVEGPDTYYYGTNATITAQPATGYHFVRWSDGNTTNPRVIKVVSDSSFTAEFEAHTIVTDPAVAATTTSTGLTEGSHCSVCHAVIVEQTIIPMLTDNGGGNQGGNNGGENQGGNNGGENQGGNNGGENQGGNNGGENQGGNNGGENQGGNNGGNNGGENNNPGTDVDETIVQAVKVYATGLTIHVENAVGDILLFDANGRAISRTTAADGEPVEMQVPQMGVYIVRTAAGGVKVICNNY